MVDTANCERFSSKIRQTCAVLCGNASADDKSRLKACRMEASLPSSKRLEAPKEISSRTRESESLFAPSHLRGHFFFEIMHSRALSALKRVQSPRRQKLTGKRLGVGRHNSRPEKNSNIHQGVGGSEHRGCRIARFRETVLSGLWHSHGTESPLRHLGRGRRFPGRATLLCRAQIVSAVFRQYPEQTRDDS
jgi:hypothetical protein